MNIIRTEQAVKICFDKKQAILTPENIFLFPLEVVSCTSLTPEEKKRVLLNWKDQSIQLQKATNEGMPLGYEINLLQQISEALYQL